VTVSTVSSPAATPRTPSDLQRVRHDQAAHDAEEEVHQPVVLKADDRPLVPAEGAQVVRQHRDGEQGGVQRPQSEPLAQQEDDPDQRHQEEGRPAVLRHAAPRQGDGGQDGVVPQATARNRCRSTRAAAALGIKLTI
jgi:hypothetical protein